MSEEQESNFKVVDRRPFNPDGTPREAPPEDQAEAPSAVTAEPASQPVSPPTPASTPSEPPEAAAPLSAASSSQEAEVHDDTSDPLGAHDPASFLNFAMSIASNAAASMGMMAHPVTGESSVDLESAKHWIDILGMLEKKTKGNLHRREEQVVEGLLADLRMQYVSLQNSPMPPSPSFSASDITGGR
jgi:hypothetical protein